MKRNNKALYEQIMRNVSQGIKQALNEEVKYLYDEKKWAVIDYSLRDDEQLEFVFTMPLKNDKDYTESFIARDFLEAVKQAKKKHPDLQYDHLKSYVGYFHQKGYPFIIDKNGDRKKIYIYEYRFKLLIKQDSGKYEYFKTATGKGKDYDEAYDDFRKQYPTVIKYEHFRRQDEGAGTLYYDYDGYDREPVDFMYVLYNDVEDRKRKEREEWLNRPPEPIDWERMEYLRKQADARETAWRERIEAEKTRRQYE